jgi:hypothetical protein
MTVLDRTRLTGRLPSCLTLRRGLPYTYAYRAFFSEYRLFRPMVLSGDAFPDSSEGTLNRAVQVHDRQEKNDDERLTVDSPVSKMGKKWGEVGDQGALTRGGGCFGGLPI